MGLVELDSNQCIKIVADYLPKSSTIAYHLVMVVVTNLGSISYLVKGKGYAYDKAVALFNEAVSANNEANDLKGLQKAADHFLENCYMAGIDYDNR